MGKIAIIVINVRDGDLDQDSIQIEEVFIKTEVEFVVNVKIANEKDIINKDKDCQKIKNWH